MVRFPEPLALLLVFQLSVHTVAAHGAGAANPRDTAPQCIALEFFCRESSDRCRAAETFLTGFLRRHPEVRMISRDVGRSDGDLARLQMLSKQFRVETPGVPSIYFCRQLIVGFEEEATTGRRIEDLLTVHVYVREGCPRCARGKRFTAELVQRYPGFRVELHEIVHDPQARERFEQLVRRRGITVPGVPTFDICGQTVVGFWDEQLTGRRLEEILQGTLAPCPATRPTAEGGHRNKASADRRADQTSLRRYASVIPSMPVIPLLAQPESPLPALAPEDILPPEKTTAQQNLEDHLPSPSDAMPETVTLPMVGEVRVRDLGLPAFTLLIGLIDGFNPCAIWVLLLLLSLLVNIHDRVKILAIAGTFVVVSGLAYLAFMAAWLNVFLLVGYTRTAQVILGLLALLIGGVNVKDFFAFHSGPSLSIPEMAKPGLYARIRSIVVAEYLWAAMSGAVVLAVLVNTIELLCTAGLPALYTQVLTMHQLPWWKNYAYLSLYITAYMLDDTVMLAVVVTTLSRTKLQERGGRWLKLVSGLVILALGLLMVFKPEWLDWSAM